MGATKPSVERPSAASRRRAAARRLCAFVGRVDPMVLMTAGLVAIAAFGLLALVREAGWTGDVFALDVEMRPATFFSAALLLAAAAVTAAATELDRLPRTLRRTGFGFAAFLLWMALDELAAVHEALERAAGADWQLLYLPVAALGGLLWLRLVLGLRHAEARVLLLTGAAAWVGAQVYEQLQWTSGGRASAYFWLMLPEELAEMLGSLLFGLAFVLLLREAATPAPVPSHPR